MAKNETMSLSLPVHAETPLVKQERGIVDVALDMVAKGLTKESVEALDIIRRGQNEQEDRRARETFNQAMAALQSEIPPILKDKETAKTKADGTPAKKTWKYASLPHMMKTLKPLWIKHGFIQRFTATATEGNRLTSTCIFTHQLGHTEETHFTAIVTNKQGDTLQDAASTDSFAKRYALMNALGIVPEEDQEQLAQNDARIQGDTITKVTPDQAEDLRQRCSDLKLAPHQVKAFLSFYKANGDFESIPASQYAPASEFLKKKGG